MKRLARHKNVCELEKPFKSVSWILGRSSGSAVDRDVGPIEVQQEWRWLGAERFDVLLELELGQVAAKRGSVGLHGSSFKLRNHDESFVDSAEPNLHSIVVLLLLLLFCGATLLHTRFLRSCLSGWNARQRPPLSRGAWSTQWSSSWSLLPKANQSNWTAWTDRA